MLTENSNIKHTQESDIKLILEKSLFVETKDKDYTNTDIDISGIDLVEKELQNYITTQILSEKIKTLQHFENNFRTGDFQFIDVEINRLQTELKTLQNG